MSSIAAGTTSTTALVSTADTTGALVLKTGASATTALTLDTSQNATFAGTVTTVTGTVYPLVSGTAQASTSGTSIDFTGIPSTAKRITVMFSGVSTNGTSNPIVQLGTSSGVTTSGYVGTGSEVGATTGATSYTTGFGIRSAVATNTVQGVVTLYCLNASTNVWVASGVTAQPSSAFTHQIAGTVTLAATLDRVRITTVNGTDTFDAGTINIMWE